jgi:2-octaprenyl-3-methyl-6-methoxy-1,4-benzoquinol hydroxylase/2-octaprenylphenol hydroxylase
MNEVIYDVTVVGAGMVGATLASLLSRCGFSVALVEAGEPSVFDPESEVGLRVSAVSPGSAAVLEQAGAWKAVSAQRHRAYRRMLVEDGEENEPLRFDAPVFNLERLGTIVENDLLQSSLWQVLSAGGLVDLYCPDKVGTFEFLPDMNRLTLVSGREIASRLLVGADGARSAVRKAVGIGQDHHVYNQSGVVAVVEKTQANPGVAWQRFLDTGPLAFLPLQDGRSSIVWSVPTLEAQRLVSLEDSAFIAELDNASHGWLGSVERCGPRAAFPLSMRLSECYASRRTILAGDAAHVVHPLAGQGVNLGLADVAALTEILVEVRRAGGDIGSQEVMKRYDRQRRSESETMAFGMHAIRSLYAARALSPVRKLGAALIKRSWLAKEVFLKKAAGIGASASRLANGESLQDLMRG